MSNETSEYTNQKPDLRTQKIDFYQLFLTSMLLGGPLLMGLIISQLSNKDEFIVIYASKSMHLMDGESLNNLWTLGGFFPIGGLFGAISAAIAVEKLGRKISTVIFLTVMIIANFIGLASLDLSFVLLIISRFLSGVASAGLMVSALCWTFERLPLRLENVFKPISQLLINVGLILSSVMNLEIIMEKFDYGMFLLPMVFGTICLFFALCTGESIKWKMLKKHNEDEIQRDFKTLRGEGYSSEENLYLKKTVEEEMKLTKMTMQELMTSVRYRPALLGVILLHIAQQLSGINAIISFSQIILKGIPHSSYYVVGLLFMNCVFSTIFCFFVGKFPRKKMLIFGHGLMAIGYLFFIIFKYSGLTSPQALIPALCIVLFAFQSAPGPLVWVITFEIFPPQAAGPAQGICSSANWISNSIVFFVFPMLELSMNQENIFIIFFVLNVIFCALIWFLVVETKNRSVNEILKEYASRWKKIIKTDSE